jgi:hypothetical protein
MDSPTRMNVIAELVAGGKLRPVIDRSLPSERIAETFKYVEQGHKKGNVVITVACSRPQWVKMHMRPGSANEPILSRAGPDEAADFRIDGKRLILTFPSKNQCLLERMTD